MSSRFFRIGRRTVSSSGCGELRPEMTRTSSVSDMMEDWRVPEEDRPSLSIEWEGVSTRSECGDRDSSERRDFRIDFGLSSNSSSVEPDFFFRIDLGRVSHSSSKSRSSSSWLPDLEQVRLEFLLFRIDLVDSTSSSSMDPDLEQVLLEFLLDFFRMDRVFSEFPSGLWLPEPKLDFLFRMD